MQLVNAFLTLAVGYMQLANADSDFEVSQAPAEAIPANTLNKVFKETLLRRQQQMYMDGSARIPPMAACIIVGIVVFLLLSWVCYTRFIKENKVHDYELSKPEEV